MFGGIVEHFSPFRDKLVAIIRVYTEFWLKKLYRSLR